MLSSFKLDWTRSLLVSGFITTYLRLNSEEMELYMKLRSKLPQQQQEELLEFDNLWIRQGIEQGRQQGRQEEAQELVRDLLLSRLGVLDKRLDERIQKLSLDQLRTLSRALQSFEKAADLKQWLADNHA
jgi:hypothetical protein